MALKYSKIVVEVVGDFKSFKGELDSNLEKSVKGFTNKLQTNLSDTLDKVFEKSLNKLEKNISKIFKTDLTSGLSKAIEGSITKIEKSMASNVSNRFKTVDKIVDKIEKGSNMRRTKAIDNESKLKIKQYKTEEQTIDKIEKKKTRDLKKYYDYKKQFEKMGVSGEEAKGYASRELALDPEFQKRNEIMRKNGLPIQSMKGGISSGSMGLAVGAGAMVGTILGNILSSIPSAISSTLGNTTQNLNISESRRFMKNRGMLGTVIGANIRTGESTESLAGSLYSMQNVLGHGSQGLFNKAMGASNPLYQGTQVAGDITSALKGGQIEIGSSFSASMGEGRARQFNALIEQQRVAVESGLYKDMMDSSLVRERESFLGTLNLGGGQAPTEETATARAIDKSSETLDIGASQVVGKAAVAMLKNTMPEFTYIDKEGNVQIDYGKVALNHKPGAAAQGVTAALGLDIGTLTALGLKVRLIEADTMKVPETPEEKFEKSESLRVLRGEDKLGRNLSDLSYGATAIEEDLGKGWENSPERHEEGLSREEYAARKKFAKIRAMEDPSYGLGTSMASERLALDDLEPSPTTAPSK